MIDSIEDINFVKSLNDKLGGQMLVGFLHSSETQFKAKYVTNEIIDAEVAKPEINRVIIVLFSDVAKTLDNKTVARLIGSSTVRSLVTAPKTGIFDLQRSYDVTAEHFVNIDGVEVWRIFAIIANKLIEVVKGDHFFSDLAGGVL